MFIEAEGLDRIVAFQPGDDSTSRQRGGVTRLLQLIGKAVELLRVQIGVILPLAQHMLDARESRVGARHDFALDGEHAGLAKQWVNNIPLLASLSRCGVWTPWPP